MDFVDPAEARKMPGLRLALSITGGPWGEAAKRIFQYKHCAFVPVAQLPGQENQELVDWTGRRNAPVAVYDDEAPRDSWLDILMLAERLAPSPALLPRDCAHRALVIGLAHELCGQWGLGWCRRLMLLDGPMRGAVGQVPPTVVAQNTLAYGITKEATEAAPGRIIEILRTLAQRLRGQALIGSAYLVGEGFTAADLYWACFSTMFRPPGNDVVVMDDWVRDAYAQTGPLVEAALDSILFAHRDMIFSRHLKT